jgi:hypothetical protein
MCLPPWVLGTGRYGCRGFAISAVGYAYLTGVGRIAHCGATRAAATAALAHPTLAVPARALATPLAPPAVGPWVGRSRSYAWDGGQRAAHEGRPHQPDRSAPGDLAARKPLGQIVEGISSPVVRHRRHPLLEGGWIHPVFGLSTPSRQRTREGWCICQVATSTANFSKFCKAEVQLPSERGRPR